MAKEKLPIIMFIIGILVQLSAGEIEITVLAGQNTTLPCIFEGMPLHVAWLKGERLPGTAIARYEGNRIIYPGNTEKYSVHKDFSSGTSSFSLTIVDVELADAGPYRCTATNLDGALSTKLRKKTYNIKLSDALNINVATLNTSGHESATASVVIPALHGTSTTPASETGRQNKTAIGDTGSEISLAAKLWIAFGVILGVIVVVALVIAINRKRIREAIKQRRCHKNANWYTK